MNSSLNYSKNNPLEPSNIFDELMILKINGSLSPSEDYQTNNLLLYEDIFSSVPLKIVKVFIFLFGFVCCVPLAIVSWFERTGQAGPHRTLINRLVSYNMHQVTFSIKYIFICIRGSLNSNADAAQCNGLEGAHKWNWVNVSFGNFDIYYEKSLQYFFSSESDNLLPKLLLIVGVICQSVFNRFIEFSHLGVNNSWLI